MAQIPGFGIEKRHFGADFQDRGRFADGEVDIKVKILAHLHFHAGAGGGAEAGRRHGDGVDAGVQREDNVGALAVCRDLCRDVRSLAGDGDRGIRHRSSIRIENRPCKPACLDLAEGGAGENQ